MIIVRHKELKRVVAVFDSSHTILDVSDAIQLSEMDCSDFEFQESPHHGSFAYSAPGFNFWSRKMTANIPMAASEKRDWHDLPELNLSECWDAEAEALRENRQAEKDLF